MHANETDRTNEIHILTYNKTWNDRKKTHSTGEKKFIETKIRRIKRWKALLSRLKIDSPLITSVMWMSYRRIDNIITVVDLVCCSFSVVVWLPIFCMFFFLSSVLVCLMPNVKRGSLFYKSRCSTIYKNFLHKWLIYLFIMMFCL